MFGSRPAIKESLAGPAGAARLTQPRREPGRHVQGAADLPAIRQNRYVPELPEVEALAADLRERAVGRVIDRADLAEFSVLKTYDPPLSALRGARITRHGPARQVPRPDLLAR